MQLVATTSAGLIPGPCYSRQAPPRCAEPATILGFRPWSRDRVFRVCVCATPSGQVIRAMPRAAVVRVCVCLSHSVWSSYPRHAPPRCAGQKPKSQKSQKKPKSQKKSTQIPDPGIRP